MSTEYLKLGSRQAGSAVGYSGYRKGKLLAPESAVTTALLYNFPNKAYLQRKWMLGCLVYEPSQHLALNHGYVTEVIRRHTSINSGPSLQTQPAAVSGRDTVSRGLPAEENWASKWPIGSEENKKLCLLTPLLIQIHELRTLTSPSLPSK